MQNISYVLQCNVLSGSIPIFFEWTKDKTNKLSESSNVKIDNFEKISILNFNELQRENSGLYTCTAKNAFGSDSTSTQLNIDGLLGIHFFQKGYLSLENYFCSLAKMWRYCSKDFFSYFYGFCLVLLKVSGLFL